MFKYFRAAFIFVAVMSFFDNLDLLATKPWFTLDGWLTAGYATAQYPKMLASPKMCKSIELVASCLRVNDLGMSTLFTISSFHSSNLSLIFWGTDSSHWILTHMSLCTIFYRLNAQAILTLLGQTLRLIHSKYFVQLVDGSF